MLASVGVSAVMGCYAVLREESGDTDTKLLLSALTVFGTSTITLACGVAWERDRLGPVPPLGIALGLIGFVLLLVAIWVEPESELLARGLATEISLALAATHASLIGIFGVGRRYVPLSTAAYLLIALLTAHTLGAIWSDTWTDGFWFWRLWGAGFVLLAAVSIMIPVLRRLEGAAGDEEWAGAPARFCPHCGAGLDPQGASICATCGARFEVRLAIP